LLSSDSGKGGNVANVTTRHDWKTEDAYWREHYRHRPYASGRNYDFYSPAYRFGYDAAERYHGRNWNDVEFDLERDWDRYEHRSQSTWGQIKDAVKDAWDRVFG
jgi:hypothetical protein